MVYLFIFIAGILFDGIIIPLVSTMLEYLETEKEVFISSQSVTVAKNNAEIKKMDLENEQSSVSAIGFECQPDDGDDECYEDDNFKENRKVGF